MCRIYYAKQMGGGVIPNRFIADMKLVAKAETLGNPDGWGYSVRYTPNGAWTTYKDKKKFNPDDFNITNANEVILHLRNSTGGTGIDNTQPIEREKWALIHNGVVSKIWWREKGRFNSGVHECGEGVYNYRQDNILYEVKEDGTVEKRRSVGFKGDGWGRKLIDDNKKSDTNEWLRDITAAKGTILEKIRESWKERSGSYSCFLISPDKRLYYFKSSSTTFRFELFGDTVFGMTSEHYFNWVRESKYGCFTLKPPIFVPQDKCIYEIKNNDIEYVGQVE